MIRMTMPPIASPSLPFRWRCRLAASITAAVAAAIFTVAAGRAAGATGAEDVPLPPPRW